MARRIVRLALDPKGRGPGGIAFWHDREQSEVHIEHGSLRPGLFRVDYSACPPPDAEELPALFASEAHGPLLDGVRARVHATPGWPWYSPEASEAHRRRSAAGAREVKIARMRGHQRGLMRMAQRRVL
jgi:hypothetical protein